ncbi:MAG: NTP transferase domain-containing protein [Vicinamibacterales bacterium]
MASTRLPGKVLADIHGQPAIARLVARLRRARLVDDIVLATTSGATDDPLVEWAERAGVAVFRGSEHDVLRRVTDAQRAMRSDVVVEVTGDCPLLDPDVIDLGVEQFLRNDCDVVTNVARPAFPQGVDVQVFRRESLERVERDVADPAVREHVSLYFYEHPDEFRVLHMQAPEGYHAPERRFQLDFSEDLAFIRAVYGAFASRADGVFGTPEVLALLASRPDLAAINAHCAEKPVR